jgi:flagellar biosynthetic protein FlhB
MDSSSQDKNLPASERKLKKARDEGQVSRSRELGHLAVLGTGALTMVALAPQMFNTLKLHLGLQLTFRLSDLLAPNTMLTRLQDMVSVGLVGCAVFAGISSVIVILSNVAVGGWVASLKPISPDFSRVSPMAGFGRLFTKDKLTEVTKMSVITAVLFAISVSYLGASFHTISTLILQPSTAALAHLIQWLTEGLGLLLLVILLLAMVDVPLQGFLYKSKMKMSFQEVKQEGKESDGNPEIKGRIRQKQRDIANGNSVGAVPKADFVLMNPTHFAVAIRYDEKTMRAPQVISKGADLLAMKIRDIAKTNSIPILQSPMLARALYANAELDREIPASLFTAVAQVLAYIYKLKAALRGDGPMPDELQQPFVPPELDPLSKVFTGTNKP